MNSLASTRATEEMYSSKGDDGYSYENNSSFASNDHIRAIREGRSLSSVCNPRIERLVPRRSFTPGPSHARRANKVSWYANLLEGPEVLIPDQLNVAKGGFAVIHYLKDLNGKSFVGKEITCERDEATLRMRLMHEYGAMRRIYESAGRVPKNIVRVYGVADVDFDSGKKKLLIMEKIDGPSGMSLLQNIQTLQVDHSEKLNLIKFTIRYLLVAARDANSAGIVHCDMTPPNFMYTKDGTLKLIDFGASTLTLLPPTAGTHGYQAPESQPRFETRTFARPVLVRRSAFQPATKGRHVSEGNVVNNNYQYGPVMRTGYEKYEVNLMMPPHTDEKSDVYSIGTVLENLLNEIKSEDRLGRVLCGYMTKHNAMDRFDIGYCLNNPFFRELDENMAPMTLRTLQRQMSGRNGYRQLVAGFDRNEIRKHQG
ncbi:hypothetical protein GWC77_27655 [Paraburkholderia sp. NMBU_R16]|uniref:protein kinase domain-containing protein n=1 Tax=Paraburkholderia sp. NMBU_R16 TaxID=2698676 RepID=UPI00156712E0|nr:AarF/UbiB family protein [Paraburkholderia sp. NMBU_R16]NRO99632.1 hypothetical protein [Paraburkholderia sp. NMBU_R16]